MSLTTEQYNEIMRGYMQKQSRNRYRVLQRRDEVYAGIPEFRTLTDKVPGMAVGYLRARLGENGAPILPFLCALNLSRSRRRSGAFWSLTAIPPTISTKNTTAPYVRTPVL